MVYNLNMKLEEQLEKLRIDVDRLMLANPLESASITNGRVRFIGGTLRVDSGGRVELEGTLDGAGNIVWRGEIDQTGPTNLRGPVAITGEDGTLTVAAETLLQALTRVLADLAVEAGGKITAGNVTIEPDKITIGLAPTSAVLKNGEFTLANGAKLAVGLTGGTSSIGLIPTGGAVDISANAITAWMRALGASISVNTGQARITAPNVFMPDLPTGAPAGAKAVLMDPSTGKLYRAA